MLTPEELLTIVCRGLDISHKEMLGKGRKPKAVEGRFVLMELLSRQGYKQSEIAGLLGKERSMVPYGVRQVNNWLKYDKAFREKHERILSEIAMAKKDKDVVITAKGNVRFIVRGLVVHRFEEVLRHTIARYNAYCEANPLSQANYEAHGTLYMLTDFYKKHFDGRMIRPEDLKVEVTKAESTLLWGVMEDAHSRTDMPLLQTLNMKIHQKLC